MRVRMSFASFRTRLVTGALTLGLSTAAMADMVTGPRRQYAPR